MATWQEKVQESIFTYDADTGRLRVEKAIVIYPNFAMDPDKNFGKRSFSLVLSEEIAQILSELKWNVRVRPATNENPLPLYTTEIVVNFDHYPRPLIKTYSKFKDKFTSIVYEDEKDLIDIDKCLEKGSFANVDLDIVSYHHGRKNAAGTEVKGYMNEFHAVKRVIYDPYFNEKYSQYDGSTAPIEGNDEDLPM